MLVRVNVQNISWVECEVLEL